MFNGEDYGGDSGQTDDGSDDDHELPLIRSIRRNVVVFVVAVVPVVLVVLLVVVVLVNVVLVASGCLDRYDASMVLVDGILGTNH